MNTSQEYHSLSDETDLIDLFTTLWEKKITIFLITFLFGCLGLMYLLVTPGKYVGEVVLRGPIGAQLVDYAPLNDGVKEHYGDFLVSSGRDLKEINQFEISTDSLVKDMVRELQDYDEVEIALKKHIPQVGSMSDAEFEGEKNRLFSKFKITRATERNPEVRVALEWPNKDELVEVLFMTLALAEQKINSGKVVFLESLADNIERRNSVEVKKLDRVLTSMMETVDLKMQGKQLFLKEQAAIARELGLAENSLTEGGQENQVSLSISVISVQDENAAVPLESRDQDDVSDVTYLRGYKSLEKEIALMSVRTNEQNYLLNSDFMETKAQAIELRNNGAADQFRETIDASPFVVGADIFNISKGTIWIKNMRNAPFILIAVTLLGFFVSSVFVLLKSAVSVRKTRIPATA